MLLRWWNWSVFLRLQQGHWIIQWNSPFSWQGRRRSNNLSSVGLDLYGGLIDIPWISMNDMGVSRSQRLLHQTLSLIVNICRWTFWELRMQKRALSQLSFEFEIRIPKKTTTCWTALFVFGRCLVGSGPVCCCQPLKLRSFILSLVWRKTASHKCWMSGSLSQMVHRFQPKRYD